MTKPMKNKSPEVLSLLEWAFPGTMKAIEAKKCPMCKRSIGDFRDSLSIKEYHISGLCQHCQDDIFG